MIPASTPIVAQTRIVRRPVSPVAYDCVKVIVIRDGSAVLRGDFQPRPVTVGDVVVLSPNTLCGGEPEGNVTATAIYLDTDYMLDQLFWQRVHLLPDRHSARRLAKLLHPDPMRVLRVSQAHIERLTPLLDELAALSARQDFDTRFFRAQALLFAVIDTVAPHVHTAPVSLPVVNPAEQRRRASALRWRSFMPVHPEARKIEELLRDDIARRWRQDELAAHACLSPSQLNRIFAKAYGVTPLVYLTILRIEEMGRLLRETALTIEAITQEVGWGRQSHASAAFRHYIGVTPHEYRRLVRLPHQRTGQA